MIGKNYCSVYSIQINYFYRVHKFFDESGQTILYESRLVSCLKLNSCILIS